VPIPKVSKSRGDACNILAVVAEVTSDGFHLLGIGMIFWSICTQNHCFLHSKNTLWI
jgi:hypothetical protein